MTEHESPHRHAPTQERYQVLVNWLDREWENFHSELSLTTAALADVQASGDELDLLVYWWRDKRGELDDDVVVISPDQVSIEDDPGPPEPEPAAPSDVGAGTGSGQDAGSVERPSFSDPATAALVPFSEAERMFQLDQRRAKAYALSGYWPDAQSLAQALVKIEAGRELQLPAIVAMNEVHVIDGNPGLGAAAQAALVKRSGRYDYRVLELTTERCVIQFLERGTVIGVSEFTMEHAQAAGLLGRRGIAWKAYPRNMLFARAMTNGVGWYCPDVLGGRFYTSEELSGDGAVPPLPADDDPEQIAEGDAVPIPEEEGVPLAT